MSKLYLYLLLLPFLLLTACSEEDEPEYGLFHLTLGMEADAGDIAMGIHDAEVVINGYATRIDVGLAGEFDAFVVSDGVPAWLTTVPNGEDKFYIDVAAMSDGKSRTGSVNFVVYKDSRSQTGRITVIQNELTYEDLLKTERKAIRFFLSKFDVVDVLPPLNEIQAGPAAPFYKLDAGGNVYMQVVRKGEISAAAQGETVYFRFARYNLLSYYESGIIPESGGNMNDMELGVANFVVGSDKPSTTQWDTAIQMPVLLGLPLGSEVNLVVASQAGPTDEIANVTPSLYHIIYYPARQ